MINNAPDIVSKIREALEGAATVLDNLMGDSDIEGDDSDEFVACQHCYDALSLLPQLESLLAKEPVSLEKCIMAYQTQGGFLTDRLKAVLDCAGVPYTEAGGEKGE